VKMWRNIWTTAVSVGEQQKTRKYVYKTVFVFKLAPC
jgi:hypothetical protein